MTSTKLLLEGLKLIGVRNPAVMTNVAALTGAVDMSRYRRVVAVLALGDMAAETIDFRLESDTVAAFNVDVQPVVAATQLPAHASNNDNRQLALECHAANLKPGHRYLRARGITGAGTGGVATILLLGEPRYSTEPHLASVVEAKAA
jgi:hypothetical protein